MKTKILNCLMLLFLSLAVVSCGSDDDEPEADVPSIVGVWQIADSQDNATFTLNSNGSFVLTDYEYQKNSGFGTYTISGDILTTIWTSEGGDMTKYKILALTTSKMVLQVVGEDDDISEWYRMS